MSCYNDYVDYAVASNNSVNENQLNRKRAKSTKYQLRQLIRPLLALVRSAGKGGSRRACRPESEDNRANEMLEAQIISEIDRCDGCSGVPVYRAGAAVEVVPVLRGQRYIPVHFAKTDAGTFFWTSMVAADSDIAAHGDLNAITNGQQAQLQAPRDRWAQA